MAATRLIAMHINKGHTVAECLKARTDYAANPEKQKVANLSQATNVIRPPVMKNSF